MKLTVAERSILEYLDRHTSAPRNKIGNSRGVLDRMVQAGLVTGYANISITDAGRKALSEQKP